MSPDYFETALRGLYEAQRLNSESLGHLIQTVDRFIDSTNASVGEGNARMALGEDAHRQLREAMAESVRDGNARMKQGEEFSLRVEQSQLRLEQSQLRMEESYLRLERIVERYIDNGKGQH